MKLLSYILIIAGVSLSVRTVNAQLEEFEYFGNSSNGYITKIFDDIKMPDGIILSGTIQEGTTQVPLMIRINIAGDIVWSTLNSTTVPYGNFTDFSIEYANGDYVYGGLRTGGVPSSSKFFWKVNIENGAVEWINSFYGTDNSGVAMCDYDSTRLLIAYFNNSHWPSMAFIAKSNGDTLATKSFSVTTSTSLSVTKDVAGNILYSRHGKLYKYNGDDWNQEIWTGSYSSGSSAVNWIDKVYVDHYGDIYVFGRNGGSDSHGNGVIVRVDPFNGSQVWYSTAGGGEVTLADFVDRSGYLLPTYRHTLVGGGSYYFRTSRVRKSDGYVNWTSAKHVTPLGSTSSTSGNGESALSLDCDCSGNIYQTGYYGDANYGPEQWGIMKINYANGNKIYDLTITEDSAFYDNLSVGMVSAVFQNTPVFVGNIEYVTDSTKVLFVGLNPSTGQVTQRHFLGGDFLQPSETREIFSDQASVYVLKQYGDSVVIVKNDGQGNVVWSSVLSNSKNVKAGRLNVTDNYVIVTTCTHTPDSILPYYSDSLDKINMYIIDKISSNTLINDSILFSSSSSRLIETEGNDDTLFVFYKNGSNTFIERWSISGFSGAQILEPAPENMDYDGHLDIAFSNYNNKLYYISKLGVNEINKQTLSTTSVYTFPEQLVVYDHHLVADTLYAGGHTLDDSSAIMALDLSSMTNIWMKCYSDSGSILQLNNIANGAVIASGTSNDHLVVSSLSSVNGDTNWVYYKDTVIFASCQPYTLSVCDQNQTILVGGAKLNGIGTDIVFDLLSFHGDSIQTFHITDELQMKSRVLTSELVSDSIYWLGGAVNTIEHIKEGFVYHYSYTPLDTNTNLTTTSPTELNIILYPNPTKDKVFIGYSELYDLSFEVLDARGRICIPFQTLLEKEISLDNLEDGIYIIRFVCEEISVPIRVVKT